jgi:hypothetical protein
VRSEGSIPGTRYHVTPQGRGDFKRSSSLRRQRRSIGFFVSRGVVAENDAGAEGTEAIGGYADGACLDELFDVSILSLE